MFYEYYPIADSEEKKFIIMQDDTDGRLAILKSVPEEITEALQKIDKSCRTLPKLYEIGNNYIIEENLAGATLLDVLESRNMAFDEFQTLIYDLCDGLTELHKHSLCHMDISLENIICAEGNYVLIDYSASRRFDSVAETVSYGTRPFCSPEHFGFDTVSAATDIYSIGKLIHHLLPYISDGVPSLFSPLICECIKVDKGQRIQNIQLFLKKFSFVCRQHTNSSFKRTIIKGNYKPLTGGYALTEDMLNELTSIHDLVDFIHKYEKSFEKCDVVDYFERILKNKGLKKSEVIQQADIERTYGYQLLNGTKKPSRDKLIQLCMGAKLKVEETQMALKRTGFAPLYPKNKRDCIIIYAIKSGKSVSETDALLDKFGVELLNEE